MMNVKKYRSTNQIVKWIPLIALAILLLLMLMPFILVTINAVKTEPEFARFGPLSLPQGINRRSLRVVIEKAGHLVVALDFLEPRHAPRAFLHALAATVVEVASRTDLVRRGDVA